MGAERGLLIVNADDRGYDEPTTRAIADCHRAGGLSSTTATVFLAGTAQAASLGADLLRRLPTGTFANL
jgi:predicted glycoside hydrolase/deacetylase ChbG (UPF0249 family)